MLGYPSYVYEVAIRGLTPSSCSAHCIQGLIGIGGVFEYFNSSGVSLDNSNLKCLKQVAVDIGDRRVMAGVHYPSDNLCSWVVLMSLADHVYRNTDVKGFLWDAIENHSWVYQSIIKHDRQLRGGSALRQALDYLHSLIPRQC